MFRMEFEPLINTPLCTPNEIDRVTFEIAIHSYLELRPRFFRWKKKDAFTPLFLTISLSVQKWWSFVGSSFSDYFSDVAAVVLFKRYSWGVIFEPFMATLANKDEKCFMNSVCPSVCSHFSSCKYCSNDLKLMHVIKIYCTQGAT